MHLSGRRAPTRFADDEDRGCGDDEALEDEHPRIIVAQHQRLSGERLIDRRIRGRLRLHVGVAKGHEVRQRGLEPLDEGWIRRVRVGDEIGAMERGAAL